MSTFTPPAGFTPAFDAEEVQRAVLAAALNGDPTVLAQSATVQAALDETYRTVFAEVMRLRAGGGFVDANVVGARLGRLKLTRSVCNGRREPIAARDLMNLVQNTRLTRGQADAYVDILQTELVRRRREEQQARLRLVVDANAADPRDLLQEVHRLAAEDVNSTGQSADEYPSLLHQLFPYAADLEQRSQGQRFEGLNCGFEHLNYLANGLGPELFMLAAAPSVGKTTFCCQVACQVAELNQVPVVFVTMEQSRRELMAKLRARLSRTNARHLLRGRLRSNDAGQFNPVLESLAAAARYARYLTIVEGDEHTTVDEIRAIVKGKMRAVRAERGLVVIDYLQQLPMTEDEARRVAATKDKVDLHVSALRRLARDLNVAVLCISSENRAGYTSKTMDVFKESGGIEYGADLAAVLTRQVGGSNAPNVELLDLNLVKNRNGERGVVHFKFFKEQARFEELGRDELREEEVR